MYKRARMRKIIWSRYKCRGRTLIIAIFLTAVTVFAAMGFMKYATERQNWTLNIKYKTYQDNATNRSVIKDSSFKQTISSRPTSLTLLQYKQQINASRTIRALLVPTKKTKYAASHLAKISKECLPPTNNPPDAKTPFKIYIYELPAQFNHDVQRLLNEDKQFSYCYNLDFCGAGEELLIRMPNNTGSRNDLYDGNTVTYVQTIRNTHQFALEAIIHYKMLHSSYRTMDPEKADVFYIPAYTGLNCLTFKNNGPNFVEKLFQHLKNTSHFYSGKPHFSTLSKIQREQSFKSCPTLLHPDSQNITYISIEKEPNPNWHREAKMYASSIIVAPYPSYVHFIHLRNDEAFLEYKNGFRKLSNSRYRADVPSLHERNVLIFLAAGSRRSNHFRAKIIDQFPIKTQKSYTDFYKENNKTQSQIMLITHECSKEHRTTTIPWMMKSVFCLQPPGDSPTRKSTFDSILSGCIPVLFSEEFKMEYPFQRFLDYSEFSITIDKQLLSQQNKNVFDIIQQISQGRIQTLHDNLLKVSKWFQYNMPHVGNKQMEDDAFTLILDELGFKFGFQGYN